MLGWWDGGKEERVEKGGRREKRGEMGVKRREEREEREEWAPHDMWTPPRQYLMVILTLFNHFNGLSHNKG